MPHSIRWGSAILRRGCVALVAMLFLGNALAQPTASSSDDLLGLLKKAWSPPNLDVGRWRAISISATLLKSLGSPVAAIRLGAAPIAASATAEIRALLQGELEKDGHGDRIQLRDVSLEPKEQQIRLTAGVTYTDGDLSVEADIVGEVAAAVRRDELVLLPTVETAIVQKAELRKTGVDFGIAVPIANAALGQVVKGLNATFSTRQAIKPIPISIKPLDKIDLAAQLGKIKGVTQASGPTIDPSVHLENAVILIEPAAREIISGLASGPSPSPMTNPSPDVNLPVPSTGEVSAAYQAFAENFYAARDKVATPSNDPPIWIAVSSSFLGGFLTNLLGHIDPPACATYSTSVPAPFATRIKSFTGALPDCTPTFGCDLQVDTRDCRRPPSCQHNHDTRECNRCLVSAFGRCQVRGNDPGCEAAKAAQNSVYDAGYAACINSGFITDAACEAAKGAQNAGYSAAKLGCETNKIALKGKCEALKELQKQIQDLADVSGQMQISGPARVCVSGFSLSPHLDTLGLDAALAASLSVGGSMHYIPLNIPGSILGCPAEWTKDFSANVDVAPTTSLFSAHISPEEQGGSLALRINAGEMTLKGEMNPPPFDAIFGQHPELAVECPILFAAGGVAKLVNAGSVAASGNDIIPELRGHFTQTATIPIQEFSIPPQVIPLEAVGRLVATAHLDTNAVTFTGVLQAP